jgi:hypothetical protein
MDAAELSTLLDQAAERGARRALESVGLHDQSAGNDIRELRGLLDSWRDAKKTAFGAMVKWLTLGFLGILAAGWWLNNKGS